MENAHQNHNNLHPTNNFALLLGNGLNTATAVEGAVTWAELLNNLKRDFAVDGGVDIDMANTPNTNVFDQIILNSPRLAHLGYRQLRNRVKRAVADALGRNDVDPHPIRQQIRDLHPAHIMTTDYDYNSEGTRDFIRFEANERLYNINRYSLLGNQGTRFWHIHGECDRPDTIMLGYEHYGGQLQQLRTYVAYNPNQPLVERLRRRQAPDYRSWADTFFTMNVHIVGLRLDFDEIDIMWLLSFRAQYLPRANNGKYTVRNTVYYYIPTSYMTEPVDRNAANFAQNKLAYDKTMAKLAQFRAFGIEVVPVEGRGVPYYENVIAQIRRAEGLPNLPPNPREINPAMYQRVL